MLTHTKLVRKREKKRNARRRFRNRQSQSDHSSSKLTTTRYAPIPLLDKLLGRGGKL